MPAPYCHQCGKPVELEQAKFCPACGAELTSSPPPLPVGNETPKKRSLPKSPDVHPVLSLIIICIVLLALVPVYEYYNWSMGPPKQGNRALTPLEIKHGLKPRVNPFTGTVIPVKNYIKDRFLETEILDFSEPIPCEGGWLVRCQFRGKNAFGWMVLNEWAFVVRDGKILSAKRI